MKIHFISIGGSIMHNLAIAMKKKGHMVTGSDDEIFEPALSRLKVHGLLPASEGWQSDNITSDIDTVILGMHAKNDNPELQKALQLGIKVKSFPELIYENSLQKNRVVIAGSHGKTTITSMVMHVMAEVNREFDYLVGARLKGFENSVKLSDEATVIILEGDEYLSSALDSRPKFLWYNPNIALISGIAWDHMNVFPTFEIYKKQFEDFINTLHEDAVLIYYSGDKLLKEIVKKNKKIRTIPYSTPPYEMKDNKFYIRGNEDTEYKLNLFGSHNLTNLEGAKAICYELGISEQFFYKSMTGFVGAGKRLEVIGESDSYIAFKDFAHSPSKVKATIEGVKAQYKNYKLIVCLELHTYSSLNKNFLPQYRHTTDLADVMYIYINPEASKLKRLPELKENEVIEAFANKNLKVFFNKTELEASLLNQDFDNSALLFMSSGNFDGWDLSRVIP